MVAKSNPHQIDLAQYLAYHRIPKNHILIKIDEAVDFSFIYDLLKGKYCSNNGRTAFDPEKMVRIIILENLYNLSDVRVMEEISVNRAFEYFCHFSIYDTLPDPTTLCKFRKLRLDDTTMDEILVALTRQMIDKGVIKKDSGLAVDSTHILANTVKKVPERIMAKLAKNIFREQKEKDAGKDKDKKSAAVSPAYETAEPEVSAEGLSTDGSAVKETDIKGSSAQADAEKGSLVQKAVKKELSTKEAAEKGPSTQKTSPEELSTQEASEKESSTAKTVIEKISIKGSSELVLPDWEKIEDHEQSKQVMKEALEEVIEQADPELPSVKEAKEILNSELFLEQKGVRSLYDKDARVGRKSPTSDFFGYKTEIAMTEEGFITSLTTQPGNYRDGDQFSRLLDNAIKAGLRPAESYGDKAYFRPDILGRLADEGIKAYIPVSGCAYRINEELHRYNKDSDTWTCINGNESGTGHTLARKDRKSQLRYKYDREKCRNCKYREECIGKAKTVGKIMQVSKDAPDLYEQSQFSKKEDFYEHYKKRARIESKNAELKRFHGLKVSRAHGLNGTHVQSMFTCIAVNLKLIAKIA